MGTSFSFSKSKNQTKIEELTNEVARLRALNKLANAKVDALHSRLTPSNPAEATCLERIAAVKASGTFENLVFEGGGTKGLAYCGALQILEERGILKGIKGYAGSSAGAITATLMAVGYSVDELSDIVSKTNFRDFIDDKYGVMRDAYSIFKDWGLAPGSYFTTFIEDLIGAKASNPHLTFGELKAWRGVDLVITGTDLSSLQTRYFCEALTPSMTISQAVRISMSIPFMFVPVMDEDGCYHVDGGLVDNYPIHAFDGRYPGDELSLLNLCKVNPKTLGLKLLTPQEEVGHAITAHPAPIKGLKDFALSIMSTLMVANERKHLRPSYWKRTMVIKVQDLPLTKFELSTREKHELLDSGINGALNFFNPRVAFALRK